MKYYRIPGFTNYYVTKDGDVYSCFNNVYRKLKTRVNRDGYNSLSIERKTYNVHWLMAKTFLTNPNNYKYIIHIDFNPLNDKLSNLKYSNTRKKLGPYYSLDKRKTPATLLHGRKLNKKQIEAIKIVFINSDFTNKELADVFGVSSSTISNIINNKTYQNI